MSSLQSENPVHAVTGEYKGEKWAILMRDTSVVRKFNGFDAWDEARKVLNRLNKSQKG